MTASQETGLKHDRPFFMKAVIGLRPRRGVLPALKAATEPSDPQPFFQSFYRQNLTMRGGRERKKRWLFSPQTDEQQSSHRCFLWRQG